MDESTFPFRVSGRTKEFLSALVGAFQAYDVRLASSAGGVQIQFQNKGTERDTVDAPVAFTQEGLHMSLAMNAVAKSSPQAMTWLRQYHDYIQQSRSQTLTAIPQRCRVVVEARVDGQLKYYLTYMVAHDDGSLAQDMPQGKLYATEALHAAPANVRQPAASPPPASQPAGQPEPASWLQPESTE
jgi:hypothetical protein